MRTMASEAYWERRKAVLMFDEMEKAEAGANEIANIFARGSVWLSDQMDRIFEKYRDKFGLTEEEARDLMSQMRDPSDIDEMMDMLRRRQDSMARQELLKKLEASAYRYRINRLKHLQDDIVRLMSQIARQQQGIVKDTLQTIGRDSFYHEIFDLQQRTGAAFPFNKVNTKLIDQVMRSKWSGENYSSRIWSNTDELAKTLKEELLLSMATGRSERDAARVISEKMQSGSMQARRLIRTESNYIYTEMDMRAYEEAGIEEYLFLATLDLRTSKICRKLDGQIFKVKDHKSGKNCPPMHPWCRSTTIGVISRELLKKMTRGARDPVTGKGFDVPMTMNYQEWYEKYVEGTGVDKKKEKQTEEEKSGSRNLTREQFERYRDRGVGPETYEEFLKAKEDPETWKKMKKEYRESGLKQKRQQEGELPSREEVETGKEVENSSNSGIIKRGKGLLEMNLQLFAEKNLRKQSTAALKKGIRSLSDRIKEHEEYLVNPEIHVPDWGELSDVSKKGLIKHWNKEINVFKRSVEERLNELKERGEPYE